MIVSKRFEKILSLLKFSRNETELSKELENYTVDNERFMSLNYLKDVAYATAKASGFHQNDENIILGNFLCNLHSEISELWESYRKNKLNEPCDKAEKMKELTGVGLTCLEEELADIILRTEDICATFKVDIAKAVYVKNAYNKTREYRHGNKLA